MPQMTFTDAEQAAKGRVTRRERFLAEMEAVIPWSRLEALIEPSYPKGERGRPPYPLSAMLRCYLMQNWFGYSDPAMEDALYEVTCLRRFAGLEVATGLPDESTLLQFRHRLEANNLTKALFDEVARFLSDKNLMLRGGSIVDATLIAAPPSTKNKEGKRDPEMHQSKKGNQWYFGMKAHVAVDDEIGLVHTLVTTPGNTADVTMAQELIRDDDTRAWGDAGYMGADARDPEDAPKGRWLIAARRSSILKLPEGKRRTLATEIETMKAHVRAKVEHVFRALKCQFGFRKVRYKGLAKNSAQLNTLFALVNLYLARRRLRAATG